jgi:hypothetical protein
VYTVVRAGSLLVAGTEGRGVLVGVGKSWQPMNDGLPPDASVVAIAVAPGDRSLVALVSGQVFIAKAQLPLRWSRFGKPLPRGSNPQAIAYWLPAHAVLVGDGSGALYASAGGNAGWRTSDTGLPVNRAAITSLRAAHGILYAGLSGGLAASSDGATWHVEAGLAGHTVDDMVALPGGGLAAALDHDGLAVRARSAATWTQYPLAALGLPAGSRVLSVTYDPTTRLLCFGTLTEGIWSMYGLAPPARAIHGIPPDDPVNDVIPTAYGLLAATNGGIIRLTIGVSQR